MGKRIGRMTRLSSMLGSMGLAAMLSLGVQAAGGETVTAVPKLDLDRYMGPWFELARLPNKREKSCLSDVKVLYAVGDKARQFQMVTTCAIKNKNFDAWNANGKMEKSGDGRLKVTYLWPFSAKYWVLAVGPEYEWALVGSPNHKMLWVLSRTATLAPEVMDAIKGKAAAQGFAVGKLVTVAQRVR